MLPGTGRVEMDALRLLRQIRDDVAKLEEMLTPPESVPWPVNSRTMLMTRVVPLTRRETEVLSLAANGLTNKEIGRALGISEQTAKNHVSSVCRKTGQSTRTGAVMRAVRAGLLVALMVLVLVGCAPSAFGAEETDLERAAVVAIQPPGPGAMTVYRVTNPNAERLRVVHRFYDGLGFSHSLSDSVRPARSKRYHVRDVPAVPSRWQGWAELTADRPFSAEVVGYDYPEVGG